jgi:hypothetical protein
LSPIKISNETAKLALTHWIRSAAQRNIDALVKVGDYYYHGLGIPDAEQSSRLEKAASYYQSAADTQISALAMWNLGWMYENGIGVPQVRFYLHCDRFSADDSRISTSLNDITTWLSKLILKLIFRFCFLLSDCIAEVSGIP